RPACRSWSARLHARAVGFRRRNSRRICTDSRLKRADAAPIRPGLHRRARRRILFAMSRPRSLQQVSVAQRLALGFGALISLCVLGAGVGAWQAQRLGSRIERVVEVNNAMSDATGRLRNAMDEMGSQARSIALMNEMKSINGELDNLKAAKARYKKDEAAL